jgi:hypothetical protein
MFWTNSPADQKASQDVLDQWTTSHHDGGLHLLDSVQGQKAPNGVLDQVVAGQKASKDVLDQLTRGSEGIARCSGSTCDRIMAVLPTMLATMRYSSVWSCEHVLGFRRVVGA